MRHWYLLSTHSLIRLVVACTVAVISSEKAVIAIAQEVLVEPAVVTDYVPAESVTSISQARQSVAVKTCVGTDTICVEPRDEVWIVSTRQSDLNRCDQCRDDAGFETTRLIHNDWCSREFSDLATCHQQDPEHVTVIIVHGNNTNEDWAVTRGMQFYEMMFGRVPCNRPPIRFVILEWESEKALHRPAPDYRLKSVRAVALAPRIGSMLNLLGGERPLLVGYSLGAQVVLSTLADLAANEGCADSIANGVEQGFHVALIAPALDANFACRQLAEVRNNPLIRDAELFVNRNDRAVRASLFINRKRCDDRCVETSLIRLADQGCLDARFKIERCDQGSSQPSLIDKLRPVRDFAVSDA